MTTHPMTPTPESWHAMTVPMTFPALVQFDDGECLIIRDAFVAQAYALRTAIRWRPWVNPELPAVESDAFKQWCESRNLKFFGETHLGSDIWQAATAAERSRFAEGVEKALNQFQFAKDYGSAQLLADLGALAKGTNL